jgi:hypothetical protein
VRVVTKTQDKLKRECKTKEERLLMWKQINNMALLEIRCAAAVRIRTTASMMGADTYPSIKCNWSVVLIAGVNWVR